MKNSTEDKQAYVSAPFTRLSAAELSIVNGGGFIPMILGVPLALKSIYDLGKAFGRELYHIDNSYPA